MTGDGLRFYALAATVAVTIVWLALCVYVVVWITTRYPGAAFLVALAGAAGLAAGVFGVWRLQKRPP